MHEMSLTQGIVEICEKYSAGKKVLSIDIEIGKLSGVVPEALEFCFEACSRETLLENARLNLLETDGAGYCMECKTETVMKTLYDGCSECGSYELAVISGKEMRVISIEVED